MPHYLFLTGRMAEANLRAQLQQLNTDSYTWDVINVGVKVAALMTERHLSKRLPDLLANTETADKIYLPGLFGGNTDSLSNEFSVAFEKGPRDLRDLPEFFGGPAIKPDFSKYDCRVFAEIVDAPNMTTDAIIERSRYYQQCGADVIDIGGLPGREFPHLGDAISALKSEGFCVSVDSADLDELKAGAAAGADYLLSLNEKTLWLAEETDAIPILIPNTPEDLESLFRSMDALEKASKPYMADPILDPLLMGFTDSLLRYRAVRQRNPQCQIFMGIGNVSELVDADSIGVNAVLMAIVAELDITAVLTTEVSDHTCRAVLETDLLRRMMHAAKNDNAIPKHYHKGALALHERKPFPYDPAEIAQMSNDIKEQNYRIRVSGDGVHLYNRDMHTIAVDPFELMRELDLKDDWTHAFYLGVELARAQISWQLGKRYLQDNELEWGVADRAATSTWATSGRKNDSKKNND